MSGRLRKLLIIIAALLTFSCAGKPQAISVAYKPVYKGRVTKIKEAIDVSFKPSSGKIRDYFLGVSQGKVVRELEITYLFDMKKLDDMLVAHYDAVIIKPKSQSITGDPVYSVVMFMDDKGVLMGSETVSEHPAYEALLETGQKIDSKSIPLNYLATNKIKTGDIVYNNDLGYESFSKGFFSLGLKVNKEEFERLFPKVRGYCRYNGVQSILLSVDETISLVSGERVADVSKTGYVIVDRQTFEILKTEMMYKIVGKMFDTDIETYRYSLFEKE